MKQEIIAKLFDGKELTSEEALFVARNLQDASGQTFLPYDHNEADNLKACGLKEEDFDSLNEIMRITLEDNKDLKACSQYIEKLENISSNPKYLRIILMNHIRLMFQSQHPLLSLLGGLGRKH